MDVVKLAYFSTVQFIITIIIQCILDASERTVRTSTINSLIITLT